MGQTWVVTLGFGTALLFYKPILCALSSRITSLAWESLENCEVHSPAGASRLSLVASGAMGVAHMPCSQVATQISLWKQPRLLVSQ